MYLIICGLLIISGCIMLLLPSSLHIFADSTAAGKKLLGIRLSGAILFVFGILPIYLVLTGQLVFPLH